MNVKLGVGMKRGRQEGLECKDGMHVIVTKGLKE